MTNQDILNHFNGETVYRFNGKLDELQLLQEQTENGYNYIIVQDTIYFVARNPVSDSRAEIFQG